MEREYAEYLLNKTKENYNLIAEDFSRTRNNPWPELEFLFDDYLVSGERVLDLGCGNGRYFEFFEKRNIDYFGADSSEKLVEIAKKRNPKARFQTADALNLPFPENYFDKVYSVAVFHHIPSDNFRLRFLKETKRVLKPGGILILTAWKPRRLKERYLFFKYTVLKIIRKSKLDWKDVFEPWGKKINRYYHFFSRKELENLVEKAGFEIKRSGTIKNKEKNRQNFYLIVKK